MLTSPCSRLSLVAADIRQRDYENHHRLVQDTRRLIDQKMHQLRAIVELAALLLGFSVIVLCQSNLPNDIKLFEDWQLWCFGGVTVIVTVLNMFSLIFTALILVAVLNFDEAKSVRKGQVSFQDFWHLRCEKDWSFAFKCFIYGRC